MRDGTDNSLIGKTRQDIEKFCREFAQVREAWRTKLTKRGGLHWWVDVWTEAARASAYATGKLVAVTVPFAFILGAAASYGLQRLAVFMGV